MNRHLAALASGALFGLGLGIAGMTSPAKVIGFLDFTGAWDASLAFVMIGAIAVHSIARLLVLRRGAPIFGEAFEPPRRAKVDGRILAGSALFGAGWGLAGYCPGPALVSLATGAGAVVFVLAMALGMGLQRATEGAPRIPSAV